jgi:hypothetical protein
LVVNLGGVRFLLLVSMPRSVDFRLFFL